MMKTNLLEGRIVVETVYSEVNGELAVIRDLVYGTYIYGGGLPQSGGLAEAIWRKSLREVKKQKPEVASCLIVGLGGGSIAKLVRKNWPEAEITGVDVDSVIVELGKKHMGLAKHNVNVVIADAGEALVNPKYKILNTKYNLICFDTYVGESFPEKFESLSFIKQVSKLLAKDGIAVFNRLYGADDRSGALKFGKTLEKVFSNVDRVYPEANIMFVCSK